MITNTRENTAFGEIKIDLTPKKSNILYVVVLKLYVHGKQPLSCQDDQVT